ncbi:hypothetical protein AB9Q10_28905 [Streptomyces krungchingensis]|uniref:hypothetical protein n=1 Tax=Streptomyces krungchingensis TaxID=1565034 RepID=UPI003CE81182
MPWPVAPPSHDKQLHAPCTTEITEIEDRGHALTIDHGRPEAAGTAPDFVRRSA